MNQILRFTKTPAGLLPASPAEQLRYQQYVNLLPEGIPVEVLVSSLSGDVTPPQLGRLHAMIRELASFTGMSFEGMKLTIKKETGLALDFESQDKPGVVQTFARSFSDCSREEITLAIQSCLEKGSTLEYTFMR